MVRLSSVGMFGAAVAIALAGPALLQRNSARASPESSCAFKGKWLDESGYDFVFNTKKTGIWGWQVGVPGYAGCPAPWKILVKRQDGPKFHARFQNTNTNGCGQSFAVTMRFSPDCTKAAGRYVNADGQGGPEIWTRVQ